jgi:hypothetical protein
VISDPITFCRSPLTYLERPTTPKTAPHPKQSRYPQSGGLGSPALTYARPYHQTCPSLADHPNEAEGRGRVVSDSKAQPR